MAEHIAGSEAAFVDLMNARAHALGMQNTTFVNCTGLDDDPQAQNHRTSAYDIAIMSRELLKNHPDITKFTTIWMDTVRNGTFGLSNTNKMVRFYPGATGLKTGFTSGAGYCLSASAKRDGMELIAVVMGCETSKDRFAACKNLLDYGFANYAVYQPQMPESATVPVRLGKQEFVTAVPAETAPLLVDKSQRNSVSTTIQLEEGVDAPVSRGQKLGTMTVTVGEQVIAQVPLVAEQTVAKLTYWDLVWELLRQFTASK
jgi:D-alanyl-D-alanine carboxypeptidase (penicillin-binding protein 5/6)